MADEPGGNGCRAGGVAVARRLKITEIFYSLQGEADTVGFPTVFVRLTGCPLRCQYCDTAYAFHGGEWTSIDAGAGARGRVRARATCASPAANRWRRRTACRCSASCAMPATACRSRPAARCRWRRVDRARDPRGGREDAGLGRGAPQSLRGPRAAAPRGAGQVRDLRSRRLRVEPRQGRGARLAARCTVLFSPSAEQLPARELADWILADRLPVRFQLQLHKVLWGNVPGK